MSAAFYESSAVHRVKSAGYAFGGAVLIAMVYLATGFAATARIETRCDQNGDLVIRQVGVVARPFRLACLLRIGSRPRRLFRGLGRPRVFRLARAPKCCGLGPLGRLVGAGPARFLIGVAPLSSVRRCRGRGGAALRFGCAERLALRALRGLGPPLAGLGR